MRKTWDSRRRSFSRLLGRLGLLKPAFRLYELSFALDWRSLGRRSTAPADGLPLPPAWMRVRVGPKEAPRDRFLAVGALCKGAIEDVLGSEGIQLEQMESILDFGCGCGRTLRHWNGVKGPALHGTDIDDTLVQWCRKNLTFVEARTNDLSPPLGYAEGTFDLVYALSVFTHLTEKLQFDWIAELARVVKPGGYLLISTKGEEALGGLDESEQAAFRRGEAVFLYEEAAGTGLCNAWHPAEYVRETLTGDLEYVRFAPAAIGQDIHLLRKPQSA